MKIQELTKLLINSGIEEKEAKCEIKMLLEHFCGYTEKDKLLGLELSADNLKILKEKLVLTCSTRLWIKILK